MEFWNIVLASSVVSAVVSICLQFLFNMLRDSVQGKANKFRVYETALIPKRLECCQTIVERLGALANEINPVAKGTTALKAQGLETSNWSKTFDQIVEFERYVKANQVVLGRRIITTYEKYICALLALQSRVHVANDSRCELYALIILLNGFHDKICKDIVETLGEASFSLPTTAETEAARMTGMRFLESLTGNIEASPDSYSLMPDNAERRAKAGVIP